MHNFYKYSSKSFLIGLSIATLVSGAAAAQTSNTSNTSQSVTLENRIAQRKNVLKLQLSTTQSQKISKNCVAAQTLIKNMIAKDKIAAAKRQQVYTDLSTQMTAIVRTLQNQGLDITELKNGQVQFDSAINKFISDNNTYSSTVDDLTAMSCESDPTGFESVLTTARQQKIVLLNDAAQVKTVKTALSKNLLKAADSLGDDQSGLSR